MQGRLTPITNGRIQSFPWSNWENEISTAANAGINSMEWTLDQEDLYENPIMKSEGQARISELKEKYQFEIPSLTGDCFMQFPFYKASHQVERELKVDFINIVKACHTVGVQYICMPLVDNGSIESLKQEDKLVNFLLEKVELFERLNIKIVFESDFAPKRLSQFIARLPALHFGINYDIGNSAAMGFDPEEEINTYGQRILNIHIKDRKLGGGTVPLGEGNAKFKTVFTTLKKYNYTGNFILQTARANDDSHLETLIRYKTISEDHMKESMI